MKNIVKLSMILAAFFLTSAGTVLTAQSAYTSNNKNAKMKLSGTSTMHKWEMNTKSMTSDARFIFASEGGGKLTDLSSLSFSLNVQTLKSGKAALDNNAYKALKSPQFKNILYQLTTATVMPEKNNKYQIKTTGNLTVAGVTRVISMDVYCILNKDLTISCTGS